MKRTFMTMTLAIAICSSCTKSRTITLEDGIRGLKDGTYSLVAVGDGLISFQVDAYHKYQYFGNADEINRAVILLDESLPVAKSNGHEVLLMDARNKEPNHH